MDEELEGLEEDIITKSATLESDEISDSDLRKINKQALKPVTKEEIFTFKIMAGDNEIDDRNFAPFNLQALKDLKNLYVGKPVIKDHRRSADNQIGRIYDTELITELKMTKANEPFTKLICKCYMLRTDSNKDLIKEIEAGIKREASTGTRAKKAVCSICGVDNIKDWCVHYPGREYEKDGSKQICYITLDGAKEAYELSLVAVPAQKRAGTTKHFGAKPPKDNPEQTKKDVQEDKQNEKIKKELKLLNNRLRSMNSFIFIQKNQEEEINEQENA